MTSVQDAEPRDLHAIVDIYNDVIDTSDAIWLDEHVTHADRLAWYDEQVVAGFPVLVAVEEGDHVVGYGSFGPFRTKAGYWPTVEHTILLTPEGRGHGVGQALLDELVERCRAAGRRVMVAGCDGGNVGAIRFHQRNGFHEVARMPAVGRKRGRPVDLVLLQLDLTAAHEEDAR